MKYTFTTENGTEKTINIPDSVLVQGRKEGLSNRETIERYLSDEGYIIDPVVAELTAKAKANGTGAKATSGKRKAPQRKPDEVKRAVVQYLYNQLAALGETDIADLNLIHSLQVVNVERIIAFEIKGEKYELTLSKKRKPKA